MKNTMHIVRCLCLIVWTAGAGCAANDAVGTELGASAQQLTAVRASATTRSLGGIAPAPKDLKGNSEIVKPYYPPNPCDTYEASPYDDDWNCNAELERWMAPLRASGK